MYEKDVKISNSLINGYQYFCDSEHPLSNSSRWIYYHRHVASIKYGRWLSECELVHHIDGNKTNNDPENLIVLGKSEHSVLENSLRGNIKEDVFCKKCGILLPKYTEKKEENLCSKCSCQSRRKFDPSVDELNNLVWSMPMTEVAKIFSVSDRAIKKRCVLLGIEIPPIGFWIKK